MVFGVIFLPLPLSGLLPWSRYFIIVSPGFTTIKHEVNNIHLVGLEYG